MLSRFFAAAACTGFTAAISPSALAAAPESLPGLSTAEEYLVEKGMNPALAKDFVLKAGGAADIKVARPADIGTLAMALRQQAAIAEGQKGIAFMDLYKTLLQRERQSGDSAYAIPVTNPELRAALKTSCLVRPVSEPFHLQDTLANWLQVSPAAIENTAFSEKEFLFMVTGHELAHCRQDNIDAPLVMKELDADLHVAGLADDQLLPKETPAKLAMLRIASDMCSRSGQAFTSHNTGLFIDAGSRGETLTWQGVEPVYEQSVRLLHAFRDEKGKAAFDGIPCFAAAGASFKIILDRNPDELRPDTRHYMEMSYKAARTFAPKATGEALNALQEKPAGNAAGPALK